MKSHGAVPFADGQGSGNLPRLSVGGRDIARVATDGIPDYASADELALCAWAVHEAVLQRASQHADAREKLPPAEAMYDHQKGWRWQGAVNQIVESLWPAVREDSPQASAFKLELNKYLRLTANLVCTNQGSQGRPATWFVRAELNSQPPAASRSNPAPRREPTRAETRLTPAEAGEDREPAEVKTTFTCTWVTGEVAGVTVICGETAQSQAWLNSHVYGAHHSAESWITEAMAELGATAPVSSILAVAKRNGFPGSAPHVTRVLERMKIQGQVLSARTGSQTVFWLAGVAPAAADEAPPAPPGAQFSCREPNCDLPPYPTSALRSSHEQHIHPGSPNRLWWCAECSADFYERAPLSIHVTRGHGFKAGSPDHQRIMATADERYARRTAGTVIHSLNAPEPEEEAPATTISEPDLLRAQVAVEALAEPAKVEQQEPAAYTVMPAGVTPAQALQALAQYIEAADDVAFLHRRHAEQEGRIEKLQAENTALRARLGRIAAAAADEGR